MGRDSLVFTLRCPPAALTSLFSLIAKTSTLFQSSLYDSPRKESDSSQELTDRPLTPEHRGLPASPIADRMLLDLKS